MGKSGAKKTDGQKASRPEHSVVHVENAGNYLRTLRLGKGLSIKDVSEATRISETNLNAIEDQNFSSLPANTFTRGLLNIYVTYLGAEAEKVVPRFMEEREACTPQKRKLKSKHSREILTPKRLAEPTHVSSMTMAGILFLIIVATFTAYCIYTSWNPFSFLIKENGDIPSAMKNVFGNEETDTTPPASEEIIIVSAGQSTLIASETQPPGENGETASATGIPTAEEELGKPAAVPETDAAEPGYTVSLHFLKDTAIELALDSDKTETFSFNAGDTASWTAGSSATLTFSQPESVEILVNNSPVPFPAIKDGNYTLHIPQDIAEMQ